MCECMLDVGQEGPTTLVYIYASLHFPPHGYGAQE